MNLDRIRNMSDEDLQAYLKSLGDRKSSNCIKCGNSADYVINVQNKKHFQQKKLCSLCTECYSSMLDQLGVSDIIWD